jgi:hypothetical protein
VERAREAYMKALELTLEFGFPEVDLARRTV